jgi:hypothetical protein
MKYSNILLLGAMLLAAGASKADTLKLKDGSKIQGVVVQANSKEVVFMAGDGTEKTYPINTVSGVEYGSGAKPKPHVITIPAGTQITARMIDNIDGKTANAGARYRASIDDPVAVGSTVAIPGGSNCTVEVVAAKSGEGMALRLRDVSLHGKMYQTSTQYAEIAATGTSKTKKAVRRGVGLGAIGAGIGALAGGGTGAAIGAAVGGGVGVTSAALAKGKQLNVPSETRLIFSLTAPLPLN